MQKLQTVNADTLLYEPLEKPSFVVDGLIPTGLTLFCGSHTGQIVPFDRRSKRAASFCGGKR